MGEAYHRNTNNIVVSCLVGLLCFVMISTQVSEALEFTVGGQGGWSAPSDNTSSTFNQWAERTRFLTGDSLVFVYQPNQDSVLYVTKDAYDSCNNETYIAKYVDGHTVFKFNQSGPFHFISGVKDKCLKNEKLVVIVLADRSNKTAPSPSPSDGGPAAATPSPAPSGDESPSPPAGTVEINPTPAPTTETSPPPPSSGSHTSALIGFAGSIAAFAASSALFVL